MSRPIIIGNNNSIDPDVEGIVSIGSTGQSYTTEDNDKTFLQNKKIVIDDTEIRSAAILNNLAPGIRSLDLDPSLSPYYTDINYSTLICDLTSGDVTINLVDSSISYLVIYKAGTGVLRITSTTNVIGETTVYLNDIGDAAWVTFNGAEWIGLTSSLVNRRGYSQTVQATFSNMVNSQTSYFGQLALQPTATADTRKVYIQTRGTIIRANIYSYATAAGANNSWSMYVRINNTTDYLIATISAATNERVWANDALSIAVLPGDYYEIKLVNPNWGIPINRPQDVSFAGEIFIKQ